jgi:uncharacterized protein (TIGR00730 family)
MNKKSLLKTNLEKLYDSLANHPQKKWIIKAVKSLRRIAEKDVDPLEWKIISGVLGDIEKGLNTFKPYEHTRKITIFGSARIAPDSREYQLAVDFAQRICQLGFMVLTGAGGGIMQAGNEGAGRDNSFGLNVKLPFEQLANPFIQDDPKLIDFKYFFTRKLFFLKESDAIALFPGGFGTQDEAFETITLCQTGKQSPIPLVLINEPGGDYWHNWHKYLKDNLVKRGFIKPEDLNIYSITDDLEIACDKIREFYRVYHSSRYVDDLFVIRLNYELNKDQVELLNQEFADILLKGKIKKMTVLEKEKGDQTENLPRLTLYFDQRCFGRLYQMIKLINQFSTNTYPQHEPEEK